MRIRQRWVFNKTLRPVNRKLLCILLFALCVTGYANGQIKGKDTVKIRKKKHEVSPAKKLVLLIIKSENNLYEVDTAINNDTLLKRIDPLWISSVNVIKPSKDKIKYKQLNADAALVITINDKRYPNAFKIMEMYMKKGN